MTRDEIQAMEAGPEMDALIEEHALGRTLDWSHSWGAPGALREADRRVASGYPVSEFFCIPCGQRWQRGATPPRCTNPAGMAYSDKIEQAWLVVEKMRSGGLHLTCNDKRSYAPYGMEIQDFDKDGTPMWFVAFYHEAGIPCDGDGIGWASAIELAICRAALAAVLL